MRDNVYKSSGLNEMTCSNCGKKLAEIKITDGVISIKCKCGTLNVREAKTTKERQERQ